MPGPAVLRRVVCAGRSVVCYFDVADTGMRNLAAVALTDAGRSVTEVAAVFGVTATYVSMLRARAQNSCSEDYSAVGWSSGGWGEGDGKAERFELVDVVDLAAFGPDPVVEELGAEVVVAADGIGE